MTPEIMKSVEQLDYRVTVGDVAAQAGLNVNLAQQGLLSLASDVGGHLQVAESGEIVYLFPQNFRAILRNKYWKLRLQETWNKIWKVLFYLIRISFGIILIASIVIMMIAIAVIIIGISSSREGDDRSSGSSRSGSFGGGGIFFFPNFTDLFWIFYPDYHAQRHGYSSQSRSRSGQSSSNLNFLEAIFSFLFGDGDPNENLEERRWQTIGTVIRNNKGAIVAEQVAPYLDNITQYNSENEDYILPVLTRFNGTPEVSPSGELIYYFPELQVTVQNHKKKSVASYLREKLYQFSEASSGQIMLAVGLGALNFILALVLGSLLRDPSLVAQFGGFIALVNSIYWILLAYAIAFLGVPLIRYFWIQWKNTRIEARNSQRRDRTQALEQKDETLQEKLNYARQFANQKLIAESDITYTTEKDLIENEYDQADRIDQEWQKRLDSSS